MKRIGITFLLFAASLLAKDITFSVQASSTTISQDQQLILYITIEGQNVGKIKPPTLPKSMDDEWAFQGSNSSTSTSISIMNGKMQKSEKITYSYYIIPLKTGTLTIPSLQITNKGVTYRSNPIKISVGKGSQGGRASPGASPASAAPPSGGSDAPVFLSASVNKRNVYLGEPVIVTFSVYTQANLVRVSLTEQPNWEGCWTKDIFNATRLNYRNVTVKGKRYHSAVIRKVAIFPASTGEKTITPMKLECAVQEAPRDFFDFFGRTRKFTIASKPIKIRVKPLPTQGKPANFTGAIGDFSVDMSADKTTGLKTGDAVTVRVRVSGKGNFKSIDKIKPEFPETFDIYQESSSEKLTDPNILTGRKNFEYVVIPRSKGTFEIPAVSLSYFDIAQKHYKTITSRSITLDVEEGKALPSGTGGGLGYSGSEVVSVGSDIRFIKTEIPAKSSTSLSPPGYRKIIGVLAGEALIIILAAAIGKRKKHLTKDIAYARFIRAAKVARARIKKISTKDDSFWGEVAEAVAGFIGDKLNISFAEIPMEETVAQLRQKGASDESIKRTRELIDTVDRVRFAPSTVGDVSPQKIKKDALSVIARLEKEVKR